MSKMFSALVSPHDTTGADGGKQSVLEPAGRDGIFAEDWAGDSAGFLCMMTPLMEGLFKEIERERAINAAGGSYGVFV